jgi:RNA recognition motif-containing protein
LNAKVFVGNLNFDTTAEEVETLFAQAGEIVGVSVPTDRATGRPRGFAFVEFTNADDAASAIERFSGYELAGRKLRVDEAGERPAGGGARPGGGGRPYGGGGAGPGGPRPGRPKGSRRNVRAQRRGFD